MDEFLIIKEGVSPFLSTTDLSAPGRRSGAVVLQQRQLWRASGAWPDHPVATAALSLPLYFGFDRTTAKFQFGEHHRWITFAGLKINYTLGVDGISLLLVLLTTLIMPFCVLASWSYIQNTG